MRSMTPEEEERNKRIDRLLEFLAANQAQLSASAHSHDARIAENAKLIAENSKQIAQNSHDIAQVADLLLRVGRIVEEQGRRMDEGFSRLAESHAALAESQRRADERLSTLMNVVERYFSNGHH